MLALGVLAGGCAGDLKNPERFEPNFNPASPEDGGANGNGGSNTGSDSDASAPSGNNGTTGGNSGSGNGSTSGNSANGNGGTGSDSDAGASNGGSAKTCTMDVAKLLVSKCGTSGCHGSAGSAAGLDLASPSPGSRLLDKSASAACDDYLLIDSAAPEESLIYLKVSANPPCGARMPFGVPLTADEQTCILEWAQGL
jgi:hypothetical protein